MVSVSGVKFDKCILTESWFFGLVVFEMSSNFSVANLDNFASRLHYNTALNLGVNIPMIFLIIFYSSKAMGYYKYYLLYSVVTTMIMDFHQTFIFGMYLLLPTMTNCCSALCRHWGITLGPQLNFVSS